jgi:hypothetical protein
MKYIALLYSPSLDRYITDEEEYIYTAYDLAEWVKDTINHYNINHCTDDFYIVSIVKLGD